MTYNTINNRIFAVNHEVSNNTWKTGLNNNDIIIGPSGAGKTTGYVIPNINQHYGSYIVADTKGNLARKLTPSLKAAGYKIYTLDFTDLRNSCAYNPLDYISNAANGKGYCEQEVVSLANMISPVVSTKDPFWEHSAQTVIACLIGYVLETLPLAEQNLISAVKVFKHMGTVQGEKMFTKLKAENPDSFAVKKYELIKKVFDADKTWSCICQFVTEALSLFDIKEAEEVFGNVSDFDICELGRTPTVLFLNISDIDRTYDRIINVFYTQAFQELCKCADKNPDSRLKVPVRIILDDFATNTYIPHFDKIISVIRSREISASIILQSISQLKSMYSEAEAITIINNCDHMLYLGGQDLETAEYIAYRTNKPREVILNMKLDEAYLFERGKKAELVDKIKPSYYDAILNDIDDSPIDDAPFEEFPYDDYYPDNSDYPDDDFRF